MSSYFTISEDFLNSYKTRNEKNTAEIEYNCGGYALKTFSWFYPYDTGGEYCEILNMPENKTLYGRTDYIIYLLEQGYKKDEIQNILLKNDKKFMLSLFHDSLRELESPRETLDDEELIAYRICLNIENINHEEYDEDSIYEDFHFLVFRDGVWKHKPGSREIEIFNGNLYKPWYSSLDLIYDGPIIFFAKKV